MRITGIISSAALSMMTKNRNVSVHWFRKGLRLNDNPSLLHALEKAKMSEVPGRFYPVYVLDGDCFSKAIISDGDKLRRRRLLLLL